MRDLRDGRARPGRSRGARPDDGRPAPSRARRRGIPRLGVRRRLAVGLGFRRLSIIDLETGNQPISNENGSVQLVFNGEIYNFRELRAELEGAGTRFTTNADTEVIVHLYEDSGARCVERLNGMFAFALWDEARRELLLARDRFGKKPLYYASTRSARFSSGRSSSRSSSIRAARASSISTALARYLAFEYVPTPHSIFAGVQKLPAGHILTWRDGATSVEAYWDLSFGGTTSSRVTTSTPRSFATHLRAAVRRRLVSDVPLGAFLSGGIDSSSVVAHDGRSAARRRASRRSRSASASGASTSRSTRGASRSTSGPSTTRRSSRPASCSTSFPTVVDVLDEPFADASILPTYLLSRFTREPVTVALGGDGSDELLAGISDVPGRARRSALSACPASLHERVVVPLADRLPVSTANFSFDFKVKRFLRGAELPPRRATCDVARRVHAGRAVRSCSSRRRPTSFASSGGRSRRRRRRNRARAPDLPLREDVPAGRHPREGRPREHGLLARGAGAVPRRRARRVPRHASRRASSCGASIRSTC